MRHYGRVPKYLDSIPYESETQKCFRSNMRRQVQTILKLYTMFNTLCTDLLVRNLLKYQDWQGQIHKMRLYYHLSVSVPSVCVYSEVSEMISTVPLKSISLPWDGKTWWKGAIPQSKKHYMSAKYSGEQLATHIPPPAQNIIPLAFFIYCPPTAGTWGHLFLEGEVGRRKRWGGKCEEKGVWARRIM